MRGARQQGTSMPQNKVLIMSTLFLTNPDLSSEAENTNGRRLPTRSQRNRVLVRPRSAETPHMPGRLMRWRHLSQLGWTQQEIADLLGVARSTVKEDVENSHLGKIDISLPPIWNEQLLADTAQRAPQRPSQIAHSAISRRSLSVYTREKRERLKSTIGRRVEEVMPYPLRRPAP